MSALARGGTVTDFDSLPKRYRDVLAQEGIASQRDADKLPMEEVTRVIRVVQEKVGDGNARRLPLGRGAYESRDYCTEANRIAVGSWLLRYFAGEFDEVQISLPLHRGESMTGAELAPKLVTKAEMDTALAHLRFVHQDWFDVLHDYFRYQDSTDPAQRVRPRRTMHQVGKRLGHSRRAVSEMIPRALNVLISYLWRDVA